MVTKSDITIVLAVVTDEGRVVRKHVICGPGISDGLGSVRHGLGNRLSMGAEMLGSKSIECSGYITGGDRWGGSSTTCRNDIVVSSVSVIC